MSHSLRSKLSGLRYKGILEDKDYKRLCHALDLEKAEQEPTTRQSCENCKILEMLVGLELEYICEDDDKDFEYCENNCNFKAPTKECYLHWAEHKQKAVSK